MKAVILAGGKGTRLGRISRKIPKPMIKIGHLPLLEHQINLLKKHKIKDIILVTGPLDNVITDYFKTGEKFGVNITYFNSKKQLGTAGHFALVRKKLNTDFIILYGDMMIDMDLSRMIAFHQKKKSFLTMALQPSDHLYDCDLIETNSRQRVTIIHPKPHLAGQYFRNLDNVCTYITSPRIFKYINCQKTEDNQELDFVHHIFPDLIGKEKVFGYITSEYIKDIGTPERLEQVNNDYLTGKIARLNLNNKRKAIFLDRDGVINQDVDHLCKTEEFKLLPRAAQGIKLINSSDYLAVVISNQSVIARGLLDFEGLNQIHKKMETLIGQKNARLDRIYFCPHHPSAGIIPKLTIDCSCRKPKTGLISKAVKEFNIDLAHSWLVGDSETDVEAGRRAGLKTIQVKRNQEKFKACRYQTAKRTDLYSAVKLILKNDNYQNAI